MNTESLGKGEAPSRTCQSKGRAGTDVGLQSPFKDEVRLSLEPDKGPVIKCGNKVVARLPKFFGVHASEKGKPEDENETWDMGEWLVMASNNLQESLEAMAGIVQAFEGCKLWDEVCMNRNKVEAMEKCQAIVSRLNSP